MKKNSKYIENNYKDFIGNNNTFNSESDIDYKALIEQLNQLNLSFDTLLVILTAVILNIYYVYYTRTQVLDKLNNTSLSELLLDGTNIPRITNAMFLYATGIFLEINYSNYEKLNLVQGKERDVKAINTAYRSFISTLLVFIATALSRSNLEV